MSGHCSSYHCLILERVEGASGVDHPASLFEQLKAPLQQIQLQRVQLVTHMSMEVLPQSEILPESSIATARHITENPIELKVMLLLVDS
jgi:hypothetical protein